MKSILKRLRNNLCKFSGEDFAIIRSCETKIQVYFSIIGSFVLLILLCCFTSALYFTEHIFHNAVADVGVGIIWGYIVTNLYVLLLYTISPTILPQKGKITQRKSILQINFNVSMILRIILVVLLAVITAQPLNIFILKPESQRFTFDIRLLLATDVRATIITIIVISIFLLPIYFKYFIRNMGEFYDKKAEIERNLIIEEYIVFKKKYSNLLESKIAEYNIKLWQQLQLHLDKIEKLELESFNRHKSEIIEETNTEKIEKFEYWSDPPFRTSLKFNSKKALSQEELLQIIYPKNNI